MLTACFLFYAIFFFSIPFSISFILFLFPFHFPFILFSFFSFSLSLSFPFLPPFPFLFIYSFSPIFPFLCVVRFLFLFTLYLFILSFSQLMKYDPLLTKSIHKDPKGSIQMVDGSPEGDVSIQAIRQWCAFHKSDKHSNSDCRAQQDSPTSTAQTSKKRPIGATKKEAKPRI